MKKLFIVLCLLAVTVLVAWKIASKTSEATEMVRNAQPTLKARPDLIALRPRSERAITASHFASPETTDLVFTAYVATSTGLAPIVRTQVNLRPIQLPIPEEAQAAREAWRQDLRGKAEYKEMFAKEDQWREKSKALKAGMTLQEVIAVMGKPTSQWQVPPEEGQIFLFYLPKGETSLFKMGGSSPLEDLTLTFDGDGKLKKINWH